jgi:hypothetical protein
MDSINGEVARKKYVECTKITELGNRNILVYDKRAWENQIEKHINRRGRA